MLAAFAIVALLAPPARAAAGCFFDNATSPYGPRAHSYIGGNIFGDKHLTNTSSSPEACCALCRQYASKGCVFWTFTIPSCYGRPGSCCRLKTSVAWNGRSSADPSTTTSGSIEPLPPLPPPDTPDLNGTVVFSAGLGGVTNYRIPAIVQTTGSPPTLVAFAEARDGGDTSASRIAVRTSTDMGATWSAVTFAAGSLNSSASRAACAKDNFTNCRVGNPAAVYDAAAGGVVLAYVVRGFLAGNEDAVGNGIVVSPDGKTWGKPMDVSAGFRGPKFVHSGLNLGFAVSPGPGTALLLESGPKKGRLLVPCHDEYGYDYASVVVLSRDGRERADTTAERVGHDKHAAQSTAAPSRPRGGCVRRRWRHMGANLVRCSSEDSDLPGFHRELRGRHILQQPSIDRPQSPDDQEVHRRYSDVGQIVAC